MANRPRCWQGQGGKDFISFSPENSDPAPLLTPLEKRGWPVTKLKVSKSYIKDPEGRGLNRSHGHHGWLPPCPCSRMGSASPWQGQSPPLDTPGQRHRLFGPKVKTGTIWRLRDVQGWRGHSGEEKRRGTCEQLLLCLLSCSHRAAKPQLGKGRGFSPGQSFLMCQTPSRGLEHSVYA